ncbi:uncharacterized protein LOC130815527 [Amaranthus tricolor]|uniref:uncharacterized protein LOC130815527 n=1 Tax=Amaranthus tricolor TaxID=29722 RepID=UPI00258D71A0|nr:uncharacterized protein LOC130815527 [Amaranthus tricolor]
MEEISKSIWKTVQWCMFFANDIVLVTETKEEANSNLEEWSEALEGKGLRISRTKTEYLRCDFSGTELIGGARGWLKWQAATMVLCEKKFHRRLKGKFHRVAIRPTLLYGTQCSPVKKVFEQRMEVTEMRILRRS